MRALARRCILSCLVASSLGCVEPPSQLDPQEDMSAGDMTARDMSSPDMSSPDMTIDMPSEGMQRLEIEGGEAEIELKLDVERPITMRAFDEMGEPTNPPEPLRWMSNNPEIVQIKGETSTSGDVASQAIVGVTTGRAVIEVTSPGWKLDRISVVVTLDLDKLEVAALTLEPGQTATATLTAKNSRGEDISDSEGFDYTDFSWKLEGVSPAGSLTIDEATGALTANAAGSATLIVSEETTGLEASAVVTVTPATFTRLRAEPSLIIGYPNASEAIPVEVTATNDYGAGADFDGCMLTATASDDALLVTTDDAQKTATLTLDAGAVTYNTLTLECGKRPDDSPRQVEIPVRVLSRQNLALGETFSCATDLDTDRDETTTCWGSNARRQLNDAAELLYKTPEPIGSPYRVAAGAHTRCELDRKRQEDNVTCRGRGMAPTGQPFTMPDAIWLSVGGSRVCALDEQGQTWCVGAPWDPDSSADPATPRRFAEQQRFQALDVGDTHGCGVDLEGVVWCWGNGNRGQVAPGRYQSSPSPIGTTLTDGVPAVDVRAGDGFTCALSADRDLYCWGINERGQLGVGDTDTQESFAKVQFLPGADVLDFTLGEDFGCAITRSRDPEATQTVQCWGDNSHGELGLPLVNFGKVFPSANPVDFLSDLPLELARVEAGKNHVCAITSAPDSEVYCWGSRLMGRLGDNEDGIAEKPKDSKVDGERVEAGASHNCALTATGEVYCWGRDTEEQRGDGALASNRLVDPFVTKNLGAGMDLVADDISLGSSHSCADNAGALLCWGLTAPMPPLASMPMRTPDVLEGADWISLPPGELQLFSTGRMHTCVVMRGGIKDNVYCAGDNQRNQLGTTPRNTPIDGWHRIDSPQLSGFLTQLESTLDTTCALTDIAGNLGGELICWGANASVLANTGMNGVLKIDSRDSGLGGFVEVQLGAEHVCARTENDHLYCWGDNSSGQVGQPTADGTSVPEPRQLVYNDGAAIKVQDYAVGWYHTCYIDQADSKTYCFGNNDYGQIGWEARAIVDTPSEASLGMDTLGQLSAGAYHTCGADVSDDKIHCWGDNTFSQSESDKLGVNVLPEAVGFPRP